MIETMMNYLLNQTTTWIGSETGGAAFLGSAATVLAILVGIVGKRVISWIVSRWNGEHLPVREAVQKLIDRMGNTDGWGEKSGETVFSQAMTITPKTISAGGVDLLPIINRGERRKIQAARILLLKKLAEKKYKEANENAEQAIKNALSLASIPVDSSKQQAAEVQSAINKAISSGSDSTQPAKGQTFRK